MLGPKHRKLPRQALDRLKHELCPIPFQHRKGRSARVAGPADVAVLRHRHGQCHTERVAVEPDGASHVAHHEIRDDHPALHVHSLRGIRPPLSFDSSHRQPPPQPFANHPQRPPRPAARAGQTESPPCIAFTPYIAFTISSTIFFASENSIMVLSRKNSSFSMPA